MSARLIIGSQIPYNSPIPASEGAYLLLHNWKEVVTDKLTPEQRAQDERWIRNEPVLINLRATQEALGKSPDEEKLAQLCARAAVHSSSDEAEKNKGLLFAALHSAIESLGGTLEVSAHFDNITVPLVGF